MSIESAVIRDAISTIKSINATHRRCVMITWHPGAENGKTRESIKAKAFMLKAPEKKVKFAVCSLDKEMPQK